jgi:hypothetical protein
MLGWLDVAWKTGEMLAASAQVIAHRTARMHAAAPVPSPRDVAEFTRMGQEKIEAGIDCARAAARHDIAGTMARAGVLWQQWLHLSHDLAGIALSRTPADAIAHHARVMRGMVAWAEGQTKLAASTAALAADVLAPVHRRTRANAKRLASSRAR